MLMWKNRLLCWWRNLENINDKLLDTPKIPRWYNYPEQLMKAFLFILLNILFLLIKVILILYHVLYFLTNRVYTHLSIY